MHTRKIVFPELGKLFSFLYTLYYTHTHIYIYKPTPRTNNLIGTKWVRSEAKLEHTTLSLPLSLDCLECLSRFNYTGSRHYKRKIHILSDNLSEALIACQTGSCLTSAQHLIETRCMFCWCLWWSWRWWWWSCGIMRLYWSGCSAIASIRINCKPHYKLCYTMLSVCILVCMYFVEFENTADRLNHKYAAVLLYNRQLDQKIVTDCNFHKWNVIYSAMQINSLETPRQAIIT